MRLPFSMRSDYLVWDPPRYQDENDRPEKPYIAPAPAPPEPAALFFNGVRNRRVGKRPFKLQHALHYRRQRTHSRMLSRRQQTRKYKTILKDPTWQYQNFIDAAVRCGGVYLEIDNTFASHSSPWDRFSPYFDLLAEYFAEAFKKDNDTDKLTADTSLLLATGQPVNTMKAVTFQPTKTVPKVANLSGKMDIETDPAAIQAALQRWSDSLASESKKMQLLLEDLRARDASVKEWEGEITQLKKTWQDRLKSLEEDDVSVQRQVRAPVRPVKAVKVSPSLLDDAGEATSSTVKTESPANAVASSRPSASDARTAQPEGKSQTSPERADKKTSCTTNDRINTRRQPTVEDGPTVDFDAPHECSSETETSEPEDEGLDGNDDAEDFEDPYLASLSQTFGTEFANAVRNNAIKAGSRSKR